MAVSVEKKVQAGTAASVAAGVVVWALGKYVLKSGVPQEWIVLIYAAVPGVLALAAGYLTPHTHRPDVPVK